MPETLEIILKARDEASKVLKGVKGESLGLKDATKLLGGAFAATAAVGAVLAKTLKDGEQLILKQAKGQRDLARTIGSTVEQAGMLIEAADDMMVSQETLTGAMETAIRKGYSPTISGLGTIADKYNAIQDPIAKAKFLMDSFGRSGADMAPLMQVGSAGLEQMGKSALLNGQVISESQARMARASEMASDALGDSWDTLRKRMATPFLPIKIYVEEHITKVIEEANQLDYGIRQLGLTQARVGPNMVYWQDQFGRVIAHTREELEAYIAKMQLRVQWDENALSAVERLRAGMSLKPDDWLQNTTTIHTTIERSGGEASGTGGGVGAGGGGGLYTDSEGNRWQYDLLKKKWVMIYKNPVGAEPLSGTARGGPLTGFNLVGEEGPEFIINGNVIPADETRMLLRRGVRPQHAYGEGFGIAGSGLPAPGQSWWYAAQRAKAAVDAMGPSEPEQGNAWPGTASSGAAVQAAVEAASAASAAAGAAVAPQVAAAVRASVPVAIATMIDKQSARAEVRDSMLIREIRSLKQELSRAVASAVQKVI